MLVNINKKNNKKNTSSRPQGPNFELKKILRTPTLYFAFL
jgi:hypothetical protein